LRSILSPKAKRGGNVIGKRNRTGRRAFLKAGGLVAAGGTLTSLCALTPGAGVTHVHAHKRAWWIKPVNKPTLGETTPDYKRFSGRDMFALYPELKSQHDGEGSFEAEMKSGEKRAAQAMNERRPGFTLPDRQLTDAAWTLMHSTKPGSGLWAAVVDARLGPHPGRTGNRATHGAARRDGEPGQSRRAPLWRGACWHLPDD
jgi:hypothetical protein